MPCGYSRRSHERDLLVKRVMERNWSPGYMSERTFTTVIHKEEDIFVAECPEVGTVSQGYSLEEAVANLKEATDLNVAKL
jgi:hypothetical protein